MSVGVVPKMSNQPLTMNVAIWMWVTSAFKPLWRGEFGSTSCLVHGVNWSGLMAV